MNPTNFLILKSSYNIFLNVQNRFSFAILHVLYEGIQSCLTFKPLFSEEYTLVPCVRNTAV
jgi:hypothetical protein